MNVFLPTSFTHNSKIDSGLSPLVKAVKAKNTHYNRVHARERETVGSGNLSSVLRKRLKKRFCRLFRALAESF